MAYLRLMLGIGKVAVTSSEFPSTVVRAPNSQMYRTFTCA